MGVGARIPNLQDVISRWWFQIFFLFTPTWGRFYQFNLTNIFLRWVETTNQISLRLFNGQSSLMTFWEDRIWGTWRLVTQFEKRLPYLEDHPI